MSASSIPGFSKFAVVAMVLALVALAAFSANVVNAQVFPPEVNVVLAPGESVNIDKVVGTPTIPPVLDLCLLVDNSGSYIDDLPNILAADDGLFDDIRAQVADSQFCTATFVYFPVSPYGSAVTGDYAYKLDQDLTTTKATWTGANSAMIIRFGGDGPESQYEALWQMSGALGSAPPSWRVGATSVIAITTDAPFHDSDSEGAYPGHGGVATTAALVANGRRVIAIKAPGSTGQMDAIATATGGSVVTTGASSAEIADAILQGLGNLPVTVTPSVVGCDPLVVSFAPASKTVTSGDDAVFMETIAVPNDASLEGTSVDCTVVFVDENGNVLGTQRITVKIPDTTPPVAGCEETNNPSGGNVPGAPGKGGQGQNQDGFYVLSAVDRVDPDPALYLVDKGADNVFGTADDATFGPFSSPTKIKYTEANGATPTQDPGAGDIDWKIKGQGDAAVYAVDASGNTSAVVECL